MLTERNILLSPDAAAQGNIPDLTGERVRTMAKLFQEALSNKHKVGLRELREITIESLRPTFEELNRNCASPRNAGMIVAALQFFKDPEAAFKIAAQATFNSLEYYSRGSRFKQWAESQHRRTGLLDTSQMTHGIKEKMITMRGHPRCALPTNSSEEPGLTQRHRYGLRHTNS